MSWAAKLCDEAARKAGLHEVASAAGFPEERAAAWLEAWIMTGTNGVLGNVPRARFFREGRMLADALRGKVAGVPDIEAMAKSWGF